MSECTCGDPDCDFPKRLKEVMEKQTTMSEKIVMVEAMMVEETEMAG